MSHLKAKSEFNLHSAKILIDDHDYFAPSVHCSYYGCFQFIKHTLNRLGHTYQMMDQEIANSRQENVKTLHSNSYPIELIANKIGEKHDNRAKKEIRDKIKTLKTFRVQSDYENVVVNDRKSRLALELSQEIIKIIEKKL